MATSSYLETARAFASGYYEQYDFFNGKCCCKSCRNRVYNMHKIKRVVKSCIVGDLSIYYFETEECVKGFAIIDLSRLDAKSNVA